MSLPKKRICIIGAGPAGMTALYQLKLLVGDSIDVKCYEKQSTWGGMWNYTWRTGTDEYGETIPYSMYRHLWTIGPKEVFESMDYSFRDHFGKDLPSFVPREILRRYLEGRWTKGKCGDLSASVDFRHVVQDVNYRPESDDFNVLVKDLQGKTDKEEIFSHVIVAVRNFAVPNIPDFPGIETFEGRILHSKDFKDAREFNGTSVLIIGGSFSASDIAIQLIKFRTSSRIICSSRKAFIGLDQVPKEIEQRLLPEKIDGKNVTFKDGSSASVDVIIICTGYIYHFPFLNGDLRFDIEGQTTVLYPAGLYKGSIWTKGGNNKLFHIGSYETYLNCQIWDIQAIWIVKYILGQLAGEPVSNEIMVKEASEWEKKAGNAVGPFDFVAFMVEFGKYMCKDIDYPPKYLDKGHDLVVNAICGRMSDVCGYRDGCGANMYTGDIAPSHHTKWIDAWTNQLICTCNRNICLFMFSNYVN